VAEREETRTPDEPPALHSASGATENALATSCPPPPPGSSPSPPPPGAAATQPQPHPQPQPQPGLPLVRPAGSPTRSGASDAGAGAGAGAAGGDAVPVYPPAQAFEDAWDRIVTACETIITSLRKGGGSSSGNSPRTKGHEETKAADNVKMPLPVPPPPPRLLVRSLTMSSSSQSTAATRAAKGAAWVGLTPAQVRSGAGARWWLVVKAR